MVRPMRALVRVLPWLSLLLLRGEVVHAGQCVPVSPESCAEVDKTDFYKDSWQTNPVEEDWVCIRGLADHGYDLNEGEELGKEPASWVRDRKDMNGNVITEIQQRCGYEFSLRIPKLPPSLGTGQLSGDGATVPLPLVVFLHGGVPPPRTWTTGVSSFTNNVYQDEQDPAIHLAPLKWNAEWNAQKLRDVIETVKWNLNTGKNKNGTAAGQNHTTNKSAGSLYRGVVDVNRIYLTGLSMGGRGTLIVASQLRDTFAGLMVLSPHHKPFDYQPLVAEVQHIPIFLSHGEADRTSSYSTAVSFKNRLLALGVISTRFTWLSRAGVGHSGWKDIYGNKTHMKWLLQWRLVREGEGHEAGGEKKPTSGAATSAPRQVSSPVCLIYPAIVMLLYLVQNHPNR